MHLEIKGQKERQRAEAIETDSTVAGAPNEKIVQNHINIALLNVL